MRKKCTLEVNSKDLIKAEIDILTKLIKKHIVDKTNKSLCKYVMRYSNEILKAAKKSIANNECSSKCSECPYYK